MYTKELMGIPWLFVGQDSALTAEGMSSIPVQGAKFHKLCSMEKKKKRILKNISTAQKQIDENRARPIHKNLIIENYQKHKYMERHIMIQMERPNL